MDKVIALWEFKKLPTEVVFQGFDLKEVEGNLYCFIHNDESHETLKSFVDHVIEWKNGAYYAINSLHSQTV